MREYAPNARAQRAAARVVNNYWASKMSPPQKVSKPENTPVDASDSGTRSKRILIGVDIGQSVDPSALVACSVENSGPDGRHFYIRYMHKWPLKTPYKSVVAKCGSIARQMSEQGHTQRWLFDVGGARPIIELVSDEGIPNVLAVQLIGSGKTRVHSGVFYLVKSDMVTALQVASNPEAPRVHINKQNRFARDLVDELRNYEARESTATGHVTYGALSSGHDDLVSALGYCVSYASKYSDNRPRVRWF